MTPDKKGQTACSLAAFTEKRQALHDQLAGTLVLSGPATFPQYEPPPPPDFG